ncbi:uncharacterized protein EI90DRAFT_3231406 [Cantharellus anzutake]|uniref:uncharacterized protein n=1 Tax=Cantharellus anzutake TaxID=1750568 RepID=UPI001907175A|nr:uncharacterized protein EI90DRAFT_3231406 [Cantharellus anzutake]KAF8326031.1 hypothetical protein EI90DRAFT_3231406 [Cantharellus anzutake]
MRPLPQCRTFNSSAVERVIDDMNVRLKDPDLARLFENTFPNTLDTTVKYFNETENLAFIITGDITAQWLRDTANQFSHYKSILAHDASLSALVRAVINNEARYISKYPYCGAFQPPPQSGLKPSHNDWADNVYVYPPVDSDTVFECKYELDSLCGFLKLSSSYYEGTKDSSFANRNWFNAIEQIFRVIYEQSQPTFDEDFNILRYYSWTGLPGSLPGHVNNGGLGEPKGYTGMVGTHHRPSDDLSSLPFLIPANAMLSVELSKLSSVLNSLIPALKGPNLVHLAKKYASDAEIYSNRTRKAIYRYGVTEDGVFAYEVNGLGSRYLMDDANVPSLLSLPYLGFVDKHEKTFQKTKEMLFSRRNPYYTRGTSFYGIGGPHVSATSPWPMALISAIYASDSPTEVSSLLTVLINSTSGLGLIHESVNIHEGWYTRPWFAWANSYFAEMLLDLARRMPEVVMKDGKPYMP